jgi:hypothetical protein
MARKWSVTGFKGQDPLVRWDDSRYVSRDSDFMKDITETILKAKLGHFTIWKWDVWAKDWRVYLRFENGRWTRFRPLPDLPYTYIELVNKISKGALK